MSWVKLSPFYRWNENTKVQKVKVLVAQSCSTLCDPTDCSPPGSSVHGILQARTLEWGSHFLLQGVFPTQGLNLGLLHCKQILYLLSYQEALNVLFTPPLIEKAFRDLNSAAGDLQALLSYVKINFSLSSWKNWIGYKNKLPGGLALARGKQKHPIIGQEGGILFTTFFFFFFS